MRLDKKDIASRLTRLNFGEDGDLENIAQAPHDGKGWTKEDSKKLVEMNASGVSLNEMSKILGRTKLAIGWRLAEGRMLDRFEVP